VDGGSSVDGGGGGGAGGAGVVLVSRFLKKKVCRVFFWHSATSLPSA